MLKSIIKSLIVNTLPDVWYALSSYRFSLLCRKKFGELQDKFEKLLFPGKMIIVLTGPFKGMKYFNRIVWGSIVPKWIGSYEEELHPIIADISFGNYSMIVDVGGAEGYYAVGLSLKFPNIPVYAFDIDPIARRRQAELAKLNGVNNLIIRKSCSHEILVKTLEGNSLMICDIEGYEYDLLDPEEVPNLLHTDILVEIHQFGKDSAEVVRDSIISRFENSHTISVIVSTFRDSGKYRNLIHEVEVISDEDILKALDETRDGVQEWLWMKSR